MLLQLWHGLGNFTVSLLASLSVFCSNRRAVQELQKGSQLPGGTRHDDTTSRLRVPVLQKYVEVTSMHTPAKPVSSSTSAACSTAEQCAQRQPRMQLAPGCSRSLRLCFPQVTTGCFGVSSYVRRPFVHTDPP